MVFPHNAIIPYNWKLIGTNFALYENNVTMFRNYQIWISSQNRWKYKNNWSSNVKKHNVFLNFNQTACKKDHLIGILKFLTRVYLQKKFDTVSIFKVTGNVDWIHVLGSAWDGGGLMLQKEINHGHIATFTCPANNKIYCYTP